MKPIPWREAFPDLTDENIPGAMLAGTRHKEGITQRRLSELTGIPQRHISEMENSRRPIGKETARKLAKALNVDYRVFL
jgi:transcriptional regulator with XRE-family HTH domain